MAAFDGISIRRSVLSVALVFGLTAISQLAAEQKLNMWVFPYGGTFYLEPYDKDKFDAAYSYAKYAGHSYKGIMNGYFVASTVLSGEWYEIDDNGCPVNYGKVRIYLDTATGTITIKRSDQNDSPLDDWTLKPVTDNYLVGDDPDVATEFDKIADQVLEAWDQ